MFDTLLQGVLLGGLYCLFALGQSLMFGVMRLTNTAQGDFIVLGAFGAIALASVVAVHPALIALALLPPAFGAGYLLQRCVLNATLGRDPMPSLVVTFGLAIVVQNALLELFSADPRSLDSAGLATGSLALGDSAVGLLPLMVLGLALAATAALQLLFHRSTPASAMSTKAMPVASA
jgi:branched-chain amino acid transport system permease protein